MRCASSLGKFMSEWREVTLGQVADLTVGFVGTMARHYEIDGVPFLRSQNVLPHRIDMTDVRFISPEFNERISKSELRPGDVVTVRTGTPGTTAVIPDSLPMANCSDLVITRPGPDVDARWLSYYMNSAATHSISSALVGAVQQHFNVGAAKKTRLALPPLVEQQAIAEVLGALDDKIAANTALAASADDLMHHTFRRMAPAEQVPLSATADFVNGKAFTKDASGTGRVVVRIAELNSGISGSTVYSDAVVDDKHVARPGSILFAWSGSLTLHRWFREEAIVNQHIFKVIPRDGHPTWLIYELVRQKLADFKAIAADKATTMGHIQRHHLDETVGLPSASELDRLNSLMSGLWETSLSAERESLTLAATRDALLPQLMSGKLRVRDAEAAASEAGA